MIRLPPSSATLSIRNASALNEFQTRTTPEVPTGSNSKTTRMSESCGSKPEGSRRRVGADASSFDPDCRHARGKRQASVEIDGRCWLVALITTEPNSDRIGDDVTVWILIKAVYQAIWWTLFGFRIESRLYAEATIGRFLRPWRTITRVVALPLIDRFP